MPLKRCKKDGVSGWKFGESGACYVGKDAKKKAIKQGVKMLGPEKFKQEMEKSKSEVELTQAEINEALAEYNEELPADKRWLKLLKDNL